MELGALGPTWGVGEVGPEQPNAGFLADATSRDQIPPGPEIADGTTDQAFFFLTVHNVIM